jgi:hypothetical protein
VARELSRLERQEPTRRVVHSVPIGRKDADLDHLVIGRPGVFCLNAKHHPGAAIWVAGNTFMVNGGSPTSGTAATRRRGQVAC